MNRALESWLQRHRHPGSLALHAVGIPAVVAGFVVLGVSLTDPIPHVGWWFAGLFAGGYALQFIGHAIEGNDAGELILVKKLLGKPYVAVAPPKRRPQPPADRE